MGIRDRYRRVSRSVDAIIGIYGLLAFVVVPWFLGDVYRGEMSVWIWEGYERALDRHGTLDAVLTGCAYLVFYSVLGLVPYLILAKRYAKGDLSRFRNWVQAAPLIIALWLAATALLVLAGLADLREFPPALHSRITQPLVTYGWLGFGILAVIVWRGMENDTRERRARKVIHGNEEPVSKVD